MSHKVNEGLPRHLVLNAPQPKESTSGHSAASGFDRGPHGPTDMQKIRAADLKMAERTASKEDATAARLTNAEQTVAEKEASRRKSQKENRRARAENLAKKLKNSSDKLTSDLSKIDKEIANKKENLGGFVNKLMMESSKKKGLETELEDLKQRKSELENKLQALQQSQLEVHKSVETLTEGDLDKIRIKHAGQLTVSDETLRKLKDKLTEKTGIELESFINVSQAEIKHLENKLLILNNRILEGVRKSAKLREGSYEQIESQKTLTALREQKEAIENELAYIHSKRLELEDLLNDHYQISDQNITAWQKSVSEFLETEKAHEILISKINEYFKLAEYLDDHIQVELRAAMGAKKKAEEIQKIEKRLQERKKIRDTLSAYLKSSTNIKAALEEVEKQIKTETEAAQKAGLSRRNGPKEEPVLKPEDYPEFISQIIKALKQEIAIKEIEVQNAKAIENASGRAFFVRLALGESEQKAAAKSKREALEKELNTLKTSLDEKVKLKDELTNNPTPERAQQIYAKEKLDAENRVLEFGTVGSSTGVGPVARLPIQDAERVFNENIEVIQRLRDGTLSERMVPVEQISQNFRNIGSFLQQSVETDLRKIAFDKQRFEAAKRQLTDSRTQILDAITETERQLRDSSLSETARSGLGRNLEALRAQVDPKNPGCIDNRIQYLEQALNLAVRMERTTILKASIEKKRDLQREIKRKQAQLDKVRAMVLNRNPSPQELQGAGLPKDLDATGVDKAKQKLEFELNGGTLENQNIRGLIHDANSVDTIFEQELVKLQEQDSDPKLGKLPLDDWTPWLADILRDSTGKGHDSIRRGQERVNVLAKEKLMADQGVTLLEAYEALFKQIADMGKLGTQEQADAFAKLLYLPSWVLNNPALARELVVNVQLTIAQLSSKPTDSGAKIFTQSVIDAIVTNGWIKDVLEGQKDVPNKETMAAGLALLHLADIAPTITAAYKGVEQGTTLGNLTSMVPLIGGIAAPFVNAVSGALSGIAASAATQMIPPEVGRAISAAQALQAGKPVEEVTWGFLARTAAASFVSFIRHPIESGKDAYHDLKSWWNNSSGKEKAVRIGVGIGIVGGVVAVIATGGVAAIAVGVGAIALYAWKKVSEKIYGSTTTAIQNDSDNRKRKQILKGPEEYSTFLQQAAKDRKNTRKAVPNAAELVLQKKESYVKALSETTIKLPDSSGKTLKDFESNLLSKAVEETPNAIIAGLIKDRIKAFEKNTETWWWPGNKASAQAQLKELDKKPLTNPAEIMEALTELTELERLHGKTELQKTIVLRYALPIIPERFDPKSILEYEFNPESLDKYNYDHIYEMIIRDLHLKSTQEESKPIEMKKTALDLERLQTKFKKAQSDLIGVYVQGLNDNDRQIRKLLRAPDTAWEINHESSIQDVIKVINDYASLRNDPEPDVLKQIDELEKQPPGSMLYRLEEKYVAYKKAQIELTKAQADILQKGADLEAAERGKVIAEKKAKEEADTKAERAAKEALTKQSAELMKILEEFSKTNNPLLNTENQNRNLGDEIEAIGQDINNIRRQEINNTRAKLKKQQSPEKSTTGQGPSERSTIRSDDEWMFGKK